MDAGTSVPPEESSSGYDGAAVAGAALATGFFPLIALIAALLLISGQTDPRKRSQLRTWAWVSGGWVAMSVVLVLLAVGTIGGAPARGGGRSGPLGGGGQKDGGRAQGTGGANKILGTGAGCGS